jgi:thiamine-monophosphate kinase
MRTGFSQPGGGRTTGERVLLGRIRSRAARSRLSGLRLGIGDDCALLAPTPGQEIAVTTDLSIAGRHFHLEWHRPEVVGHRTLARGLSDLAAMGAKPLAAFVSLGLPAQLTSSTGSEKAWIERFFDGFLALADRHRTPLAGGDLAQSPLAMADVVLVGAVPAKRALLRSGARAGDLLYVTGHLGGAAAGLASLGRLAGTSKRPRRLKESLEESLAAHLYPEPRIAQGLWLQRRRIATAAIDLSDGLSTDLTHLCEESHTAAEVDAGQLPIHPASSLADALHGGEDYELLFTAPPELALPGSVSGVPLTRIGRMVRRRAGRPLIALLTGNRVQALHSQGWEHFV